MGSSELLLEGIILKNKHFSERFEVFAEVLFNIQGY
jgi:hypothetical protein